MLTNLAVGCGAPLCRTLAILEAAKVEYAIFPFLQPLNSLSKERQG